MARLRNRIVKADFWTDPELLRWPRDKRQTYRGLWQMAEDSACLEDDPFSWKLLLWPSPADADITVELMTQWRDELVGANKLIPYEAEGKRYLYIRTFHQHEHPRNPQSADLPLPAWVKFVVVEVPRKDGGKNKVYRYEVDEFRVPGNRKAFESPILGTESVPSRNGVATESPVRSGPDQSSPELNLSEGSAAEAGSPVDNFSEEEADPFEGLDLGDEVPEPTTSAKDLVAYYASEHQRLNRGVLKQKDTDRVAGIVTERLKAGRDPELIRAAIRKLVTDSKDPALLKTLIEEAFQTAPADTFPRAPPVTADDRAASAAAAERARSGTPWGAKVKARAAP